MAWAGRHRGDPALTAAVLGGLFMLLSITTIGDWIWTSSIPTGSPVTTISARERWDPDDHESRMYSFITVGGEHHVCYGSEGRRGTTVTYDPSWPTRCREPRHQWVLVGGERIAAMGAVLALGAFFYAMISVFFLSGGRSSDAQRLAAARQAEQPVRKGRKPRKGRR